MRGETLLLRLSKDLQNIALGAEDENLFDYVIDESSLTLNPIVSALPRLSLLFAFSLVGGSNLHSNTRIKIQDNFLSLAPVVTILNTHLKSVVLFEPLHWRLVVSCLRMGSSWDPQKFYWQLIQSRLAEECCTVISRALGAFSIVKGASELATAVKDSSALMDALAALTALIERCRPEVFAVLTKRKCSGAVFELMRTLALFPAPEARSSLEWILDATEALFRVFDKLHRAQPDPTKSLPALSSLVPPLLSAVAHIQSLSLTLISQHLLNYLAASSAKGKDDKSKPKPGRSRAKMPSSSEGRQKAPAVCPLEQLCNCGGVLSIAAMLLHAHSEVRTKASEVLSLCLQASRVDPKAALQLHLSLLEQPVAAMLELVSCGATLRSQSSLITWPEERVREVARETLTSAASHLGSSADIRSLALRTLRSDAPVKSKLTLCVGVIFLGAHSPRILEAVFCAAPSASSVGALPSPVTLKYALDGFLISSNRDYANLKHLAAFLSQWASLLLKAQKPAGASAGASAGGTRTIRSAQRTKRRPKSDKAAFDSQSPTTDEPEQLSYVDRELRDKMMDGPMVLIRAPELTVKMVFPSLSAIKEHSEKLFTLLSTPATHGLGEAALVELEGSHEAWQEVTSHVVDEVLLARSLHALQVPILVDMLQITEEYGMEDLHKAYMTKLSGMIEESTLGKIFEVAAGMPLNRTVKQSSASQLYRRIDLKLCIECLRFFDGGADHHLLIAADVSSKGKILLAVENCIVRLMSYLISALIETISRQ